MYLCMLKLFNLKIQITYVMSNIILIYYFCRSRWVSQHHTYRQSVLLHIAIVTKLYYIATYLKVKNNFAANIIYNYTEHFLITYPKEND